MHFLVYASKHMERHVGYWWVKLLGHPVNEFKIFINIASSFSKKHNLPTDTRFHLCPSLATPQFFMLFDFCQSDGWTMVSLHSCNFLPFLFTLGSSSSQVSAFPSGPGKRQSLQDSVTILRPRPWAPRVLPKSGHLSVSLLKSTQVCFSRIGHPGVTCFSPDPGRGCWESLALDFSTQTDSSTTITIILGNNQSV